MILVIRRFLAFYVLDVNYLRNLFITLIIYELVAVLFLLPISVTSREDLLSKVVVGGTYGLRVGDHRAGLAKGANLGFLTRIMAV